MARQQQNPPGTRRAQRKETKSQRFNFADLRWDTPSASQEFFWLPLERPDDFAGSEAEAVLLPPSDQPVSTTPSSLGSVVKAFPHGLTYTNQTAIAVGMMALIALPMFVLSLLVMADSIQGGHYFVLIFDLFLIVLTWLTLRADITGYRYPAVLLDRAAGKMHLFFDDKYVIRMPDGLHFRRSWLVWPLWGGGAFTVESHDWACVRAQVVKARIFTGTVGREEAALQLVITDAPGSANIVATAGVGLSTSSMVVQPLLDGWEHMRRFMAHEGPLFVPGDEPNRSLGKVPLWQAPFFGQTLIGPGALHEWKQSTTSDMLYGLFMLLILPMMSMFGLSRWVCTTLKSEPKWPAEILASVGGAELRGRELDAWRNVVPDKPVVADSSPQALR